MQVKISARHGHLNEEHQAQIHEKAEKLLHFFDRLTFIEVTVDLQHPKRIAEVIATAEHKHEFVAQSEDKDLIVALNAAIEKVKQQVTHYKDKLQDHRHDPSANGGHKP